MPEDSRTDFLIQTQRFLDTTSAEILSFDIFKPNAPLCSDKPQELRNMLKSISKAHSRLFAIDQEYRKIHMGVKRQLILAEENLESARAVGMAELSAEQRKGISKEERTHLVDRSLNHGEVDAFRYWRSANMLLDDHMRLVAARIKELSFMNKNVLGQLECLRQEGRLHHSAENGGNQGPVTFNR